MDVRLVVLRLVVLAMLKMIVQSKDSNAAGNIKTAKKSFSDIRKNIKDSQA